jgi:hypothetical protein
MDAKGVRSEATIVAQLRRYAALRMTRTDAAAAANISRHKVARLTKKHNIRWHT